MEFKEFSNPLEEDYDITSSLKSNNVDKVAERKKYVRQLFDVMEDIPEDIDLMSDVSFVSQYGITKQEYANPNAEVIKKVVRFQKQGSQQPKQI